VERLPELELPRWFEIAGAWHPLRQRTSGLRNQVPRWIERSSGCRCLGWRVPAHRPAWHPPAGAAHPAWQVIGRSRRWPAFFCHAHPQGAHDRAHLHENSAAQRDSRIKRYAALRSCSVIPLVGGLCRGPNPGCPQAAQSTPRTSESTERSRRRNWPQPELRWRLQTGAADVVDATVVVMAAALRAIIWTSDAQDISALAIKSEAKPVLVVRSV
jgi:hypothetical protein